MFNLEGKIAIVTGANKGIGQGIAMGLAEAGADIVAVCRSNPDETIAKINNLGRKCHFVQANLIFTKPIKRIIDETIKTFGSMDILVNNAGIIRRGESIDFNEQDWDDVMNVNLKTPMFLAQAFAQHLVENNKGGKIINIASMLSFQGGICVPSYTSSKSGIMGLTKILSNEWAKYNINVNAIAPGYIATDNTKALQDNEKRNAEILDRISAGRWGKPEDLKGAAVFLAAAASDYVHGFTIAVDGGWLAR